MVKVLILDADGVLINGQRRFSTNLERDYGITLEMTTPFFEGVVFRQSTKGKADLKEVISPYLKEWGWKGSTEELLDYWFKSEHFLDLPLIEYIQDLRKKGMKCVVATNQEKYRAEYILKKMGFEKSFDKVYVSCHLGYMKLERQFYKKVLEDLGVEADEVLFWDDTESHIKGALDFGIQAEIYTNFEDFKAKMATYTPEV